MKIRLFLVLVLAVITVGCATTNSAQQGQDRSDKIAALEAGIADHLSGEVGPLTSGGKERIHNVISGCSVYIVDETENRAKVTAKFDNGIVYASGEVERDEEGKWHADDSSISTSE